MAFATRFFSYTLIALLLLQGHLVQVRGDQGPGPDSGDAAGGGGSPGGDAGAYGSSQWNPDHGNGGHHGSGKPPGSWPPQPNTQVLWGQFRSSFTLKAVDITTTEQPDAHQDHIVAISQIVFIPSKHVPSSLLRPMLRSRCIIGYAQCNPNDHP
ncbi:LOW QUALITY PROTEIN: hypothetical protein CVT25_013177 [Psilocybe cyanescens]|uniref:Uncharacterized protein n=1 Tax=Psilocybe cyanescens TaxID=93625 RepID=A0A409XCN3_PSICY|nr:LOW QUALITY PROTEIN: hypothetical protein CVT25_013177 [Psilocybe cyanescens]